MGSRHGVAQSRTRLKRLSSSSSADTDLRKVPGRLSRFLQTLAHLSRGRKLSGAFFWEGWSTGCPNSTFFGRDNCLFPSP